MAAHDLNVCVRDRFLSVSNSICAHSLDAHAYDDEFKPACLSKMCIISAAHAMTTIYKRMYYVLCYVARG